MRDSREASLLIRVAAIAMLGLFIALAAVAYLSGREVQRASELITKDAVPGTIAAHAMRGAISRSIGYAMVAGMADQQAEQEANFAIAQAADVAFEKAVKDYEGSILINPEGDRKALERVRERFAEFLKQRKAYEALIRAGDRTASRTFLVRDLVPVYTKVIEAAEELLAYNHANSIRYAGETYASIHELYWVVGVVMTLAVICTVVLVMNLTVRRREVMELVESERRLREVMDNLHISVALLDLNLRVQEINRGPLERAGLKREDVAGRPLPETYWWAYSDKAKEQLRAALQQAAAGAFVRHDVEYRMADGKLGTADFGCGPIRDAAGRVTQIVVAAIDITGRKELEQQFLRAQRMEAIGTLAGGVAHDLNNILAPMLMAAGLLKLKLTAPGDQNIIALIEGGAQRGAGIIKQLLTFGRGTEDARGLVQVRHLVRDMGNIVQATFPRNIEFHQNVSGDLWPVLADATQLHQVLLNFSVNARDAMPKGGTLTLGAQNVGLTEADVKANPHAKAGSFVMLTATDTGEGIPREIIDRIFDAFFTTKPVGKGTGLGLSTVQSIVKSHDGFMTVESEPGKGTTFKVYLPAAEKEAAAAATSAADLLPRGQGETVLLVDDEPAMQTITRELLELHNYRVIVAGNGEKAVRRYLEQRDAIKLVVTDVDMPVMDGPELIRSLHVLDPQLKFVVLSGSMLEDRMVDLKTLGINEVLKKPCDSETLLKKLQQALGKSAAP